MRIRKLDRIPTDIEVQIDPAFQADWVSLYVPPRLRIVISEVVVDEPGFFPRSSRSGSYAGASRVTCHRLSRSRSSTTKDDSPFVPATRSVNVASPPAAPQMIL